jgi:hypothetical protein
VLIFSEDMALLQQPINEAGFAMINMRDDSDITNILTSLVANTRSPNHFYNTRSAQGKGHTNCRHCLAAVHLLIIAQKL